MVRINPRVDEINLNDDERMAYEDRQAWLRMEASGLQKKFIDGREEGEMIGLEKGKLAQAYETAKVMKLKMIDVNVIAECTGLSLEEINKF
jgi:predicted transposase/invertase (TIGR01784 family)